MVVKTSQVITLPKEANDLYLNGCKNLSGITLPKEARIFKQ